MKIIFHDDTEKTTSVMDCTGYRCKELHLEPKDFLQLAHLVERNPPQAMAVLAQLSGCTGTSRMSRLGVDPEKLINFSVMEQQMTTDFFFGRINNYSDTGLTLDWDALKNTSSLVSTQMFTNQLNRLLSQVGGMLSISCGTSCPDFYALLDALNVDDVAFVELYTNHYESGLVLSCKIYLLEGVLDFRALWMADDEKRSRELVDTLIMPIHRNKLENKTFINNQLRQKTKVFSGDHRNDLNVIFGKLNKSNQVTVFLINHYQEQINLMSN